MRPLRVLCLANDGFSAGHVVRTIAVARGLARRAERRGILLELVLATTSEADALLSGPDSALVVVRLPSPLAARRANLSDRDRRRLVRGVLDGIVGSFAPDLLVIDTFPSGPHGEAAGLAVGRSKRALVRRSVPVERAGDPALAEGLADIDRVIVADDPLPDRGPTATGVVRVPPITSGEAVEALPRKAARAKLGLPEDGRFVLVASGGGGDPDASAHALAVARAILRAAAGITPVLAAGPLARLDPPDDLRTVRAAPLQPLLGAFDGAFSAAGYNTSHELVKARLPAVLFAEPRPFDDQAGRAARFAAAGLAHPLRSYDDDAVAEALAWIDATPARPPAPAIEAGGADRAADALLDLVTGTTTGGSALRP